VTLALLPLSADGYAPHPLHASERTWTETNCYVDVWIEVLHSLGLDPLAAAAFSLGTDFEGDQWTFSKYPPEDLRSVYGLEVTELNVWRPVVEHVAEQLDLGRLCTVEVDSWFLPDTRQVTYRLAHGKTTIIPQMLDRASRRLGYFHNAGYFELDGDDFDGVFGLGAHEDPTRLPPYVEVIRLDRLRDDGGLMERAVAATRDHLARRPADNPITRLGVRLAADVGWLATQELETFHLYAFGTCRQCGAAHELASSFVGWLDQHDRPGLSGASDAFRAVAEGAKTLQFALARVVRGRTVDLDAVLGPMAEQWATGMAIMDGRYGG
jgi:Domain of unknown function (DUF1839)